MHRNVRRLLALGIALIVPAAVSDALPPRQVATRR